MEIDRRSLLIGAIAAAALVRLPEPSLAYLGSGKPSAALANYFSVYYQQGAGKEAGKIDLLILYGRSRRNYTGMLYKIVANPDGSGSVSDVITTWNFETSDLRYGWCLLQGPNVLEENHGTA